MLPQPDATTCGPTCLHAVYRYYGAQRDLSAVVQETKALSEGGTLAVLLGCHALRRGFRATIYTFNIQVFDPTWFKAKVDLKAKLAAQRAAKTDPKLRLACDAYLEYLELGGEIRFRDLTTALIRNHLKAGVPILTGLSATYLYQESREAPPDDRPDDIGGVPSGHFVVLCGYDATRREVLVADPLHPNPLATKHHYSMDINRVLCSILLGIVTYDANLLILEPDEEKAAPRTSGGEVRRKSGS
ncbi:MAG: C39 family peptidase [Candidatus Eisenbacteria bacterium]|uniref:C39 family peptidase n=1 Tax=Eiseniibacteriota bacterium TaxID=2212470 RepID=A0A956LY60_UNCEI|nr:C39 family peptidase [Candidatus Eisenbacteria bacterium]